ncbi:hypothetical protein HETIRDRAFT_125856 [Heterobasidion irregulare TC 32-1]|uniref:Uncharacterized protein n=1 Tax=Heterobasidion irregulare (strain TC 32-1) TaxID=747525 RepID=W4JUV1_HETIT|nr:uncharacterized protein HETIRDRAFT_125856 [Heterobasidion irregulare TC 32-1]ETW76855.1 hypothetical protein HETIRDRAFT_125856 [Heterobasidion irregulare TC 32-1]
MTQPAGTLVHTPEEWLDGGFPDGGILLDTVEDELLNAGPCGAADDDDVDITAENSPSLIEDIRITERFISELQTATLKNGDLPLSLVQTLQDPDHCPQGPLVELNDPILRLSLDLFLAVSNASQQTYTDIGAALMRYQPALKILSFDQIQRRVAELSGVVPIIHHMCVNTCVAFTGPFRDLTKCPVCYELRYDPLKPGSNVPRQEFHTIPLGPQLQAVRRSVEGSQAMRYRHACYEKAIKEIYANHSLAEFCDVWHGTDFLDAVQTGHIKPHDPVLMFSVDGAQLYRNKSSDCWIYIWILLDRSPDMRYKKKFVLPGGFVPGPSKPKNLDSFIFPGMYHLSALQREGMCHWDAIDEAVTDSNPFLALGTADSPAMAMIFGGVGHHGAYGCRLYCPQKGCHKRGGAQYYPACLRPCDCEGVPEEPPDYDLRTIKIPSAQETEARYLSNLKFVSQACTPAEYRARRLQTGVCKPSIFSGLDPTRRLRIPALFPADLMHLTSLNLTDLFVGLFRGTLDCSASDNLFRDPVVWQIHGKAVAAATPYLPGIFDRPPRNPAEKINSGYKAVEFLTWIYGLAPALLHGVLPDQYWRNFCKLVAGIRLVHQRNIRQTELKLAHRLLIEFSEEFEQLYYQRKSSRLHFCRQSVHALSHLARQVTRCGPPGYTTQFTMERMIGDLGGEIKQHSNPYANLSQRGVRRAQVNALKAMVPNLDNSTKHLPRGSKDLGDHYLLLRAQDSCARSAGGVYDDVGSLERDWVPKVRRWARLRLPNGQVTRSLWKESRKPVNKVRMARNVKIISAGLIQFAEVRYYFTMRIQGEVVALALVSLFSQPDTELMKASSNTVLSCEHRGDSALAVINVKTIVAGVAMIPHGDGLPNLGSRFFVVEKMGLEIASMDGVAEDAADD